MTVDEQRFETPLRIAVIFGLLVIGALIVLLWTRSSAGELPRQASAPRVPSAGPSTTLEAELQPPKSNSRPPSLSPEPEDASASQTDSRGVVLYGLITDEAGEPIDRGFLTVRGTRMTIRGKGYSLAGLEPGPVLLTCTAPGYHPVERELDLPSSPVAQRHDLVLAKATILKVRIVTPDGEPLWEVLRQPDQQARFGRRMQITALATREAPTGHFPLTLASTLRDFGVGTWRGGQGVTSRDRMPREFAGELQLSIEPPVHVSAVLRNHVLVTELVSPGQEEVTLTVPVSTLDQTLGSLRVAFIDADTGEPIEGMRVSVTDSQTGGGGPLTDQTGSAYIAGLCPGLLEMRVASMGYAYLYANLRLEAGQELDLGVIRMPRPRGVSGQVVDSEGNPVSARVRAQPLAPVVSGQSIGRPTNVDSRASEGFELRSLYPTRYLLRANVRELGRGHTVVDLTQDSVENVRIQLEPTVSVNVQCNFSEVEIYDLAVLDMQGNPVWEERLPKRIGYQIQLAPGPYTVRIRDDTRLIRQYSLTVTPDGATVIVP